MDIRMIGARWHEPTGFSMERHDTGDEYIFIQYLSPARVFLDGKLTDVDANSCILYDKHSYQYMTCTMPLVHDWMHITGNLDGLVSKYGFKYNTVYKIKNSSTVTSIVIELEEEFLLKSEYYERLLELKIEELILKIMREAGGASKTSHINSDTLRQFLLFRLRLSRDFQQPWTIELMANALGFSQARFCGLYKEIFGISPKRDLQNVRIEQAKNMLIRRANTVTEIAQLCGFSNRFHFTRMFKKETGKTPLEYVREKQQQ